MLSELIKKSLPVYEIHFPIRNKKYRFRPMTVKEEKYLLLAQNEKTSSSMAYAVKTILESCFENLEKVEELELIDVQTAFLHIRTRSIGEAFSFDMTCPETGEKLTLNSVLSDFKPNNNKETTGKIKLNDEIVLILKTPTLNYFMNKQENIEDEIKDLFINCFKEVHTKADVISKSDTSLNDISEFYDSLSVNQYSEVINFFENIPRMELNINYKTSDGIDRQVKFNGLDSFFELASVI